MPVRLGYYIRLISALSAAALFTIGQPAKVEAEEKGVVIEVINRLAANTGIQPGDLLTSWQRLSAENSDLVARGELDSPFHWEAMKIEESPRGTIRLRGQRNKEQRAFDLHANAWDFEVRPNMSDEILPAYLSGIKNIQDHRIEEGISRLKSLAQEAALSGEVELACWILFRSAELLAEAGKQDLAHAQLQAALAFADSDESKLTIFQALGKLLHDNQDFNAASQAYEQAGAICKRRWGKTLCFAKVTYNLGVLAWGSRNLTLAGEALGLTRSIQEYLAPNSLDLAFTYNATGSIALSQGDLEGAETYLNKALAIRERWQPNSLAVAGSLNNLAVLAKTKGLTSTAINLHLRALDIRRKSDPSGREVATSLSNLGILYENLGDLRRATEYYQIALEIELRIIPDSLSLAGTMTNLGSLKSSQGDLDLAEDYYKRALDIIQRRAPTSQEAVAAATNLGNLFIARGDLASAQNMHKKALDIQNIISPGGLETARSLNNLANVTRAQGDLKKSLELYKASLLIKEREAHGSLAHAIGLSNMGMIAGETGDLATAYNYYKEALKIRESFAPGTLEVSINYNNLGSLAWLWENIDLAEEYSLKALAIQERLAPGSFTEAETLHDLGTVQRKRGNLTTATAYFDRAATALELQTLRLGGNQERKAEFRADYIEYYHDLIETRILQGDTQGAFHAYERSRAQVFLSMLAEREMTLSLGTPDELEKRRTEIISNYDRIQRELALADPAKDEEKINILLYELQEARHNYEDLASRARRISPALASVRYPRSLDLKGVQETLEPGTAVLAYSVHPDKTYLFILSNDKPLEVKLIPTGSKALAQDIEKFLRMLSESKSPTRLGTVRLSSANDFGYHLYKHLMNAGESRLQRSQKLVIIPDGPLHALPWGALTRPSAEQDKGLQFLAEWKPIHIALSGTVYSELRRLRTSGLKASDTESTTNLVAFGDPHLPQALTQDNGHFAEEVRLRSLTQRGLRLDPLPYSRLEVKRVAQLYTGSAQEYLSHEATEERAKSLPPNIRMLHFATHSTLNNRFPLDSAVILTIPDQFKEGRENGLLQAWEIFEQVRLDADLVVLSACESALGKDMGGEGLIGLTRAFQYAGARTVLASLWKISDRTTAELMVRFYKHLKAGKTKDEALRAAQIELIRGPIEITNEKGEVEFVDASAPYYWAAFQLYGDWQ